jgi:histidinol-phosphate/aromatic aminotransferase/cobyric acid decarboxylase-like protein
VLFRSLVPRTFGPDHPLAGHLRFTVRTAADDDRLLDRLAAIVPALPHSTGTEEAKT